MLLKVAVRGTSTALLCCAMNNIQQCVLERFTMFEPVLWFHVFTPCLGAYRVVAAGETARLPIWALAAAETPRSGQPGRWSRF